MTTSKRWLLRGALIGGFVACFGCNPLVFPMFMQGESSEPPTLKRLASDDNRKEITVAILVSAPLYTRQELLNVDRELSRKTVEQLRQLVKGHGDKITIVEPRKVDNYLANHPKWKTKDQQQLASDLKESLKVDYVIDIEINSMSLYEGGHELFRGRADVHVNLLNTNDPDSEVDKEIPLLYPKEASGPIMADNDTNVLEFRSKFLDTLAKTIAYCFCNHPAINQMDDSRQRMPD